MFSFDDDALTSPDTTLASLLPSFAAATTVPFTVTVFDEVVDTFAETLSLIQLGSPHDDEENEGKDLLECESDILASNFVNIYFTKCVSYVLLQLCSHDY